MTRKILIALFMLALLPNMAWSQKNSHKLGADFSAGYVFPSHKFMTGRNYAQKPVNKTISAHLKYGTGIGPHNEWARKYPYTYQGIGISYHHFFNDRELGSPIAAYIFQHARIADITHNLSIDYEWDFGVACNWVKYDKVTNPYNRLMGSSVTAYMNIGIMVNWNFSPSWNLTAGIDVAHVSNGNTAYPNYGLNTMTFKTGITHSLTPDPEIKPGTATGFGRHVTYDLVLYGSWRKKVIDIGLKEFEMKRNFAIAGLNFNPMYNVCKYFRTGLSLDMLYDTSSNIKDHITSVDETNRTLQYGNPPFAEQFMLGLSARAELVMSMFSINVGIGKNIIASGEDKGLLYELIALKASMTKNLYLHVGCLFYSMQESRCLMLGLGYRFNNKY